MRHHTTHAADRALERHGLTPMAAEWNNTALTIMDNVAGKRSPAMLLRKSGGVERWLVRLADFPVVVVWCPLSAEIVTVLP